MSTTDLRNLATVCGSTAGNKVTVQQGFEEVADLIDGISYSTTEVATSKTWIDSKTIYRKVINFGAMPNATTKSVAHGITGIDEFISVSGFMTNSTEWYPLPFVSTSATNGTDLRVDGTNVIILTAFNWSARSAYIILEYTKV